MNILNQFLIINLLSRWTSSGYPIIQIEESCQESCSCIFDDDDGYLTIKCEEIQSNITFPSNIHLEPYISKVNSIIASNNSIQTFPSNICDFPYLRSLDLSYNELTDIKSSYIDCKLNYLKSLRLNNNNISLIDKNAFDNMVNLERLNLEDNQIDQILPVLFFNLKNLKYIHLSKNLIKSIELWPIYIFRLMYLDLSYNQIKIFSNNFGWSIQQSYYLPGMFVKTHPSIMFLESTKINLQFNEISSLDDESIEQYGIQSYDDYYLFITKHFWVFDLSNNPITCNCQKSRRLLAYSYNLLNNNSDWSYSPLFQSLCLEPASTQNKSIMDFDHCQRSFDNLNNVNETTLEIMLESELTNQENSFFYSTTLSFQEINLITTETIEFKVSPQKLSKSKIHFQYFGINQNSFTSRYIGT
jgi:hypothetical protein